MIFKKELMVVLCCIVTTISATVLQKEHIPRDKERLELVLVKNDTPSLEFKIFIGGDSDAALITPLSTFIFSEFNQSKPLALKGDTTLVVLCSKGSYLPVYLQDGGPVSGLVLDGYNGPYYLSMWLAYPHVSDLAKLRVRYVVKKDKVGKFGIQIGSKGDYRLIAIEDVKFLHDDIIEK